MQPMILEVHKKKRVPSQARIIGRNLKELRESAGMTQKQIAAILDITFQQVQKYERGENRFPVEKLHLLKIHFDVPYSAFFTGMDEDESTPPWPARLYERLAGVEPLLRSRIERVVAIMME